MSDHKFTADRSDMAHRIKRELRSSTVIPAIVQPPVEMTRWGDSGTPVDNLRDAMRGLISNGEVTITKKDNG